MSSQVVTHPAGPPPLPALAAQPRPSRSPALPAAPLFSRQRRSPFPSRPCRACADPLPASSLPCRRRSHAPSPIFPGLDRAVILTCADGRGGRAQPHSRGYPTFGVTRDDAAPRSSRVSCGVIMSVFVENPVDRRERRIVVSSCASYLDGDGILLWRRAP